MRETPQAAAAYHEYAAMGPERSLRALSDKTGTKLAQLGVWSSTHRWQERCKLYDAERIEERRRKRDADIERMNERHALIGTTQQQRALEQLAQLAKIGKLGSQAAVMLLKLAIDVERTARGEPTTVERHEQTGVGGGPIQGLVQHDLSLTDDPETAALARALIQRATSENARAADRRARRIDGGVADPGGPGVSGE